MSEPTTPWVDTAPYPDEEILARIEGFEGSALALVDLVVDNLPGYGTVTIDKGGNDTHPSTVYRFTTGGWSGCEDLLGALSRTMFHCLFWRESRAGGLVVYEVPDDRLDWRLLALNSTEIRAARRQQAADAVCTAAGHLRPCAQNQSHLSVVDTVLNSYGCDQP